MRAQYLSALLLGGLSTASPVAPRQAATPTSARCGRSTGSPGSGSGSGSGSSSGIDMVAAIQAVMPTSTSCDGAKFPDECRTAEQAAPFVSKACADLNTAECAATVALMALESAEFKFKHNVSPGRPGQGTANMMLADNVKAYATELFGADQVASKSPDEVLALVTPDEHNFHSAAWWLTTKCTAAQRSALQAGTDAGWIAYNECIGVDGTVAERKAYWDKAKTAFGL